MGLDERGQVGATSYRRLSEPAYRGAFVARYDELRPKPPAELFELLISLAPSAPPALVVDLGAGTGISTAPWSAYADRVIGIDANPEMLRHAREATNVEYRVASAERTQLPTGCADLVTCAQSFHWMPHEPTIAEISRLLRPGGVFAAYDYDWPPLVDWEVDAAFLRVIDASGVDPDRPEKARHVERLRASGCFRAVREVFLQARQLTDAEHVARLPLAFGPVARKLDAGATEEELGLDQLAERSSGASTPRRTSFAGVTGSALPGSRNGRTVSVGRRVRAGRDGARHRGSGAEQLLPSDGGLGAAAGSGCRFG